MNRKIRTVVATLIAALSVAVAIAAAPANAFDNDSINDIKIGNRSTFSGYQRVSAGRPQVLVFKIGRFVI